MNARADEARVKPLVVITTNEERELPSAFLRRCVVLQIHLPTQPDALRAWLRRRAHAHFEGIFEDDVLDMAANMVLEDRGEAKKLGLAPPGQAEFLDMLRAVNELKKAGGDPKTLLSEIRVFALKKHPDLHPDAEKKRR